MNTMEAARRKWRGILMALGISERFLSKKHGPCPFCGGKDRFRFDDKDGRGTFFCSQCGSGDGFAFLKLAKGWEFKDAAKEVDRIVGNIPAEKPKSRQTGEQKAQGLQRLWEAARPLADGDPVTKYLLGRNVLPSSFPSSLRYHSACPVPYSDDKAEAMLALVRSIDGVPVNIHRTFLAAPEMGERRLRATMPGDLPDGCCIQIYAARGSRLGIAEGIETAIAAAKRFRIPTWAAINSTLLAKWQPPTGVDEVTVFGDCDPAYGGQKAAYELAYRLVTKYRVKVDVRIPTQMGKDWADADVA